MKYRIKYLIIKEHYVALNILRDYYKDYYIVNDLMNKSEEIEIEIKDNDMAFDGVLIIDDLKKYNFVRIIRNNKICMAMSDEDFIKFKINWVDRYNFHLKRGEIRTVKDLIIEEIVG